MELYFEIIFGGIFISIIILCIRLKVESGLTSLGCGHLTSETCFFSQEYAHFGAHTTQFCISVIVSKKVFFFTFEFMAGSVVASA